MTSYVGVLVAIPGRLLCGVTRVHESSRFELPQQAKDWVWATSNGDTVSHAFIRPSNMKPQIAAKETGHDND